MGAFLHELKFALSEVRFEIDNWPKVGDALYRKPELVSERIEYYISMYRDSCITRLSVSLRGLSVVSR